MGDNARNLLSKFHFKLASASDDYIQRRKHQAVLFLGAAAATIFSSRFAYKSTVARQFLPTLFQGNHQPPTSYNFVMDAAVAVGAGTMLCGSVTSMVVFGTCWVYDVSSFQEFGWRMKALTGENERQKRLAEMAMDEESAYIQDSINEMLDGDFE